MLRHVRILLKGVSNVWENLQYPKVTVVVQTMQNRVVCSKRPKDGEHPLSFSGSSIYSLLSESWLRQSFIKSDDCSMYDDD